MSPGLASLDPTHLYLQNAASLTPIHKPGFGPHAPTTKRRPDHTHPYPLQDQHAEGMEEYHDVICLSSGRAWSRFRRGEFLAALSEPGACVAAPEVWASPAASGAGCLLYLTPPPPPRTAHSPRAPSHLCTRQRHRLVHTHPYPRQDQHAHPSIPSARPTCRGYGKISRRDLFVKREGLASAPSWGVIGSAGSPYCQGQVAGGRRPLRCTGGKPDATPPRGQAAQPAT